ncbi:Sjogren's syndrome/scleroderma autoantigen 1 family protein [Methanosarcina sp. UBA5]|uniref:Sjogren's syndrome/scleroderma autoantigen 1 family protein n=1 Tax=Methanosarcina sp. UBA5 TaxID=1915593 RepID=UPI0025CD6EAC|nr:Sjogren's syndrome/scleroderma autoantigen 1 family protein [Methanosarcina sp. UBA5]
MDSEKDKKVKRIARFLELGGTMLAEHCKVCGAPKFRYQGRVICPICDVQEEREAPESAAEVQAPEPGPSTEKDKSSLETKKRVQAHRQKPRFGLRTSETADEEEKVIEPIEEEVPVSPSEEAGRKASTVPRAPAVPRASTVPRISAVSSPRGPAVPVTQAAPSERAEKLAAVSKVAGVHRDRKLLEDLLFRKIVNIADSLQDETDPRRIAEDLELIGKGLGLIERLKQL